MFFVTMNKGFIPKVDDSISPSSRPASLGSFDLRACSITSVHTNDHGNCIRIETKGRDGFTISCESADEAEQWLSALTQSYWSLLGTTLCDCSLMMTAICHHCQDY